MGVAACSVAPTYRRPDVALPAQWQSAAADATTAGTWPQADWWKAFGVPELDELIAQAQSAGDDMAAAVARVREADAQARIAGAPLLPNLGLEAAASRTRSLSPASGTTTTFDQYSPQLAASYELDFWGKNRAAHAAALYAAQASRFDRRTVLLTVTAGVAQGYFELRALNDRIRAAQDNLGNAQHILDGLTLEQQVGTVTALDVVQQATAVAVLNASIPTLLQQRQQVRDALAVLVGRTPETLSIDDGGLDEVQGPPVVAGLPSALLARRPDVASAEAQLMAANANIGVARAAFLPSIDLTASGGYASRELQNLLLPQSRVFALTAGLSETIFDNGARRGTLEYSHARYTELLSGYHKAVLNALGNVEDALSGVQQTAEQLRREQQAADTARRAFDFAQQQMSAGVTNILTVLNTETTLFNAQDQLVQVKYLHLQALVQLYQALGGGWQRDAMESFE